jgi:AcrR family transcriptional regulator
MRPPAEPARASTSSRAQVTRATLIELAAELFAERGYVQTSIRDITRRGEVTSGAIYGHFRNKADLLAEAISARTEEELEARSVEPGQEADYIETLTRLSADYPNRRRLRALIVQGAAAAQTDDETRTRLREEQLAHLDSWVRGYEDSRDHMGIDPSVDIPTFVLLTWAIELGLGVLEGVGIEPTSEEGWADVQNRVARAMQLPPDDQERKAPRKRRRRASDK